MVTLLVFANSIRIHFEHVRDVSHEFFFMLFVPPLPNIESLSVPYSMMCARSDPDCSDFAGRFLTSGVEYHYQNLYFVSALQRLVWRAACYVRAYSQDQLLQNITPSMDKKESERKGELLRFQRSGERKRE